MKFSKFRLIARSEYGLMVQILASLITYLLFAIYYREQHKEKVSIKRVRKLRIKIQNEIHIFGADGATSSLGKQPISSFTCNKLTGNYGVYK